MQSFNPFEIFQLKIQNLIHLKTNKVWFFFCSKLKKKGKRNDVANYYNDLPIYRIRKHLDLNVSQ